MIEESLVRLLLILVFIVIVPFAWVGLMGDKSEDPRVKKFPYSMEVENASCDYAHIREFGVHISELGSSNIIGSSPFYQSSHVIRKPARAVEENV